MSKVEQYDVLVKELFSLLDKTEETSEGRAFHPNRISSCRLLDGEKLEQVLKELKNLMKETDNETV